MPVKLNRSDRKLLVGAGIVFILLVVGTLLFSSGQGTKAEVPTTYSSASGGAIGASSSAIGEVLFGHRSSAGLGSGPVIPGVYQHDARYAPGMGRRLSAGQQAFIRSKRPQTSHRHPRPSRLLWPRFPDVEAARRVRCTC